MGYKLSESALERLRDRVFEFDNLYLEDEDGEVMEFDGEDFEEVEDV
jgi:hypothetical protein